MRSIWQIYKTDWLNVFKVPTGILLIAAIVILPCLYAWINIKSVWDPYSHTEGIRVAVTSEDQGATVAGKPVHIGDELLNGLKTNKKLGWTIVDEEEARRGLDKGTYYAAIRIPADFSSRLTGIVEGKLDRPEVIYSVNEKVSAIAPKITASGVSELAKTINESFTEAVSEALLTKLKEIGVQIEEQLPTIRKVETGLFELEARLPDIQAAGRKVLALEEQLPAIHSKAQIISELESKLPEINRAASYVLKIQSYWPTISGALSEIAVIRSKLPDIRQAAARIEELDRNFGKVSDTVALAVDKANKALEIVAAAQGALPELSGLADKGVSLANGTGDFLAANDEAFATIAPLVKQNAALARLAADSALLLAQQLRGAAPDSLPSADEANAVKLRLAGVVRMINNAIALLDRIDAHIPNRPLSDDIERLRTATERLNGQIQLLGTVAAALDNGKSPSEDAVRRLGELSQETSDVLGGFLSGFDSELVPDIARGIGQLRTIAGASADKLQSAQDKLPDIAALLADAKTGLEEGLAELTRLQGELPQIRAKVHELAQALQSKTDAFAKAVDVAAPFVESQLPAVGKKLDEAASFVRNDLPRAEKELAKVADFVRYKLPEVEAGVRKVASLVRDDLPQLERAVRQAADKLREVEANNRFAELAKLLRGDIRKESEFLASPVAIRQNRLYPIPNYGSAMAPFYCVLSLWVGATLLISLLKSEAENPEGRFKPYQLFMGRLATFSTIGFLQALSITLGNLFLLRAYVADKLPFVLFAMLISAVFVAITYTLLSVFGNVGKGIAIIFMVFQFSSSGGTFPISMTSPFFQALNPFMPFTYAISLLREGVGGILWETALRDMLYLAGFIGLSWFAALFLKRPLSGIIRKSNENAKKTKIIA